MKDWILQIYRTWKDKRWRKSYIKKYGMTPEEAMYWYGRHVIIKEKKLGEK